MVNLYFQSGFTGNAKLFTNCATMLCANLGVHLLKLLSTWLPTNATFAVKRSPCLLSTAIYVLLNNIRVL